MYTIRTCIKCGQKIHIRPKGSLFQVKNKCPHITCELISIDLLNEMTVPLRLVPELPNVTIKPHLCNKHQVPLDFRMELGNRHADLFYCPECHKIDKLIPKRYIKQWKKRTWRNQWKPGDVLMAIFDDYKTMTESVA